MTDRRNPVFRILHSVIFVSIVGFAVVVLLIMPTESTATPGLWQWAWLVPVAVGIFGVGFVKGRLAGQTDLARVRAGAIIIWALAEGAALCGLVFGMVTASWLPMLAGTGVGLFLLFVHRPSTFRR